MDTRLYGRTETKQKTTLHAPLIREEQSMAPGQQIMQQPVRQTELDKEIIRLESFGSTLTEIEKNRLKELAPPEPDFQILSKEELGAKKKAERSQYKKNLKAYEGRKKDWESNTKERWEAEKTTIETGVKERAAIAQWRQEEIEKNKEKLSPVDANPDAMDQALIENTEIEGSIENTEIEDSKEETKTEKPKTKVEILNLIAEDRYSRFDAKAKYGLDHYMGSSYVAMNHYLRGDKSSRALAEKQYVEWLKDGLDVMPGIPCDMVTRRVAGRDALAGMLQDDEDTQKQIQQPSLTEEQMKDFLQKNIKNGISLTNKSFCSTSIGNAGAYADKSRGIEFIILVRKGTHALDIHQHAEFPGEKELLLNAGTRFRVVDAFFNDGSEGSTRDVCKGEKNTWKIYLETIPSEDSKGEERKEGDK